MTTPVIGLVVMIVISISMSVLLVILLVVVTLGAVILMEFGVGVKSSVETTILEIFSVLIVLVGVMTEVRVELEDMLVLCLLDVTAVSFLVVMLAGL